MEEQNQGINPTPQQPAPVQTSPPMPSQAPKKSGNGMNILLGSLVFLLLLTNATERQKINTKNLGIVVICNIILNLILIPQYGISGASLASSLSTLLLFVLNLRQVMKVVDMPIRFFKPLIGVLLSSLLMYVAVSYTKDIVGWILSILVGMTVYLFFSFITKTIKKQDFIYIKNSFKS